jgi:glycosyltransferase involved in cell wall biosynthesis
VIARMNVGGPAYHVSVLAGRLDRHRFDSLLVHGGVGPGESSFAWRARAEGCRVEQIGQLGPEVAPFADAAALRRLAALVRRFRPDIVHTHTAKAGALGRLAALTLRPRPLIVHTYHGHVLEGYFGPLASRAYRTAERALAHVSDCLIGVSQATVDDLVRLGVAPAGRFRVIPVGLDIGRFVDTEADSGARARLAVGATGSEILLVYVGRLVPIKRVDVLLRAVGRLRAGATPIRLVVVGDGTSRPKLEGLTGQLGLGGAVRFLGWVDDVTAVTAAADVAVLASDNEGTPVSLIEAAAAGLPAVATAVGGVPDVVLDGTTGLLVPKGDDQALADRLCRLIDDAGLRARMGASAQEHVLERYSSARLVRDVEALYEELLASHPHADHPAPMASR